MASLANLPAFADELLAAFVTQLQEQGLELPERQYRTPGSLIPWDGEQLTVSPMGIEQGQPGHPGAQTVIPPQALTFYAVFAINLLRAVPVINTEGFADAEVPTAEELDAAGVMLLADEAALILAASKIYQFYAVTAPGEGFVIGPLSSVGPEGGLAGNRVLVSVSLS